MTMTLARRALLVATTFCLCSLSPASAQTRQLLPYRAVSEDLSEQRRSVFVRIDRRLDDADLQAIAADVQARAKRSYARTQVNFILPGMPSNQSAWASVLFAPDAKILIHGLSRADEDVFLAEHKADRRSLLGSWLTSSPAPLGRLTIYSDHGKVFAEWRLRGGQKTVDELFDTTTKTVRRFDVPGGGYFVLTRAGELEIWDKTNLIATAERIRPEQLATPTVTATAGKGAVVAARPSLSAPSAANAMPSSPTQPEPRIAATLPAASSAGATALAATASPEPSRLAALSGTTASGTHALPLKPDAVADAPVNGSMARKTKSHKASGSVKGHTKGVVQARSKSPTTGDEISAKLAGRF